MFTRSITREERWRNETCDGAHVDNMTFIALKHMWEHCTCDQHGTNQIDTDNRFNVTLRIKLFEPVHTAKPGIVEQDVYFSVEVKCGLHHQLDLGGFVDIHRDRKRLSTFILNICCEGL